MAGDAQRIYPAIYPHRQRRRGDVAPAKVPARCRLPVRKLWQPLSATYACCDGEIKYVETDITGNDDYDGLYQVRARLRGRSMRRRVYNPDRPKYPMKRVRRAAKAGKFERISWDESRRCHCHQYAASYRSTATSPFI